MIVEIGGGNSGIAEYLEKGLKQGRIFSRDELDHRVVLDGDLELTNKIINSIEDNGQERYLHITLSFREDDISNDLLQSVTAEYKSLLMSAYNDDEYNFYAEAHLPKIQSIEDSKTGKMIERKPHIHIVIPERNLLTGNKLLPTGYTDTVNVKNIPYLDSIQEYINYKYNLESPKDFMREGGHHSANVLSRIKGDFFGEKQSKFKAQLVDEISSGKINTLESFQRRLSDFGEVKIRNKGKANQYFAVKLAEDKKFTNLNHPVFSEKAIVTKALPKPDIDTINARLSEWKNRVSKEIKFVDFATPSFRQQYAKADLGEKADLLIEREQSYERKHRQGSSLERASGRQRNHQSNASNTNSRQSKPIARTSIGLSSVQGGVVVRGATQRGTRTQSLLSKNELNYLRNGEPSINSSLRRNDSSRRRGNARGRIDVKPPISSRSYNQITSGVPKQSYQKNIFDKSIESRSYITPFEHYLETVGNTVRIVKFSDSNALSHLAYKTLDSQVKQAEMAQYAEIRRNIEPAAFLNQLEKIYAVDPKNHKISYAKDGSPRFNVGKRNLNASDFLTKHLNLQWQEAKSVLEFCYANQHNKNINQERLAFEKMKSNIKAFDNDLRRFEKNAHTTLHNMNVDNRNAFREEKKRIYARHNLTPKIRNQELAIASFRCMQRQELIDEFAQNTASFVKEAKQYFQQSGYSIRSLEEIDMATKAGQKLQDLQPNSIAPATKELEREDEKKGLFNRIFDRVREQNPLNQENAQSQQNHHAKDIYATQSGEEVGTDYRGNIQFKNLALQESLKKNNIGVAKHTDGKIEYKSLTDGKLICTDDGDKMKIHQKDMSPENVKFFLEVSIDRYGNELQINGKKEFKDMVVEAAAANNLPVILKPAELQEQLIARRKELEMEQKVEVGNSIEKATPEQAKDEQRSSIEPVQSKSAANDEFRQPQAAEPLKAQPKQAHTPAEQPKPVQEQPQATTEKAAAISQTKAESSKTTERPAHTIEFKYDESAKQRTAQESAVVAGRFYSVKVNGVPVQEAMKSDPNVAKVLENAAKNSPDLKAKNITADNLKSGFILGLQTSNVGAGKFNKPETLKLNGSGQQISTPKAQAEKSAGANKGKSSDISL
uniref:Relaxase NikB n=1 Tax=Haemophilus influenzae biotype aegyptius TaxID=725 RepID=Q4L0S4_HAEIF|nr:LPD7 domain-containing protein [Haemophilus influenzae]AAV40897.1 relaxase NikB [Haemophilus influenzae biotype aegyptius]